MNKLQTKDPFLKDGTHQLRRRINNHTLHEEVVAAGNEPYVYKCISSIAKEKGVGVGLLLANGGYRIVELEHERLQKIQQHGPELLDALIHLVDSINPHSFPKRSWDLDITTKFHIGSKTIPDDKSIIKAIAAIRNCVK